MDNPQRHVIRLSQYKAALKEFQNAGIHKIYAKNLADAAGVQPVQVRKDFFVLGITGNKKGGYDVDQLMQTFEKLLGLEERCKIIVVGYGRIGASLVDYRGFYENKIEIVAAFDKDNFKINANGNPPILPMESLEPFIETHLIQIAALCVPNNQSQAVVNQLVNCGIKGLLNFSSRQVNVPKGVFVNNIDLTQAMETLIFQVNTLSGK